MRYTVKQKNARQRSFNMLRQSDEKDGCLCGLRIGNSFHVCQEGYLDRINFPWLDDNLVEKWRHKKITIYEFVELLKDL